jgi:PRTRC genetic system ThiF family protein
LKLFSESSDGNIASFNFLFKEFILKITHQIHRELLTRRIDITVVGAGGTGSALLPRLMQLHFAMLALGHPGGLSVTVFDNDTVSESNIGRQGFFPCDVGQNKALLLVNRLNMAWGTSWHGIPNRLKKSDRIYSDIIIGCVDSRKARAAIIGSIQKSLAYYIDSGNGQNSGQVIIGELGSQATMKRHDRLPTVADLFPEMVDASLDDKDEQPSCSMAEALKKQSLVINTVMAAEIFNLLWTLIRSGSLKYSGRFVNLDSGTSTPIRLDTETWERMGYLAPEMKKPKLKKVA